LDDAGGFAQVDVHQARESKESLPSYIKRFKAQVEATENVWGQLIPYKLKGQLLTEQSKGREKLLACLFLGGVNQSRYRQAIDQLNNDFLLAGVCWQELIEGAGVLTI
jgi:hypothetical protein